ncbi:MAG: hypothetical protein AAB421_03685 [Patescibacteria group bacterium]
MGGLLVGAHKPPLMVPVAIIRLIQDGGTNYAALWNDCRALQKTDSVTIHTAIAHFSLACVLQWALTENEPAPPDVLLGMLSVVITRTALVEVAERVRVNTVSEQLAAIPEHYHDVALLRRVAGALLPVGLFMRHAHPQGFNDCLFESSPAESGGLACMATTGALIGAWVGAGGIPHDWVSEIPKLPGEDGSLDEYIKT